MSAIVHCSDILPTFIDQMAIEEIKDFLFQQDGTNTHMSHKSMRFSEKTFAERIISKDVCPPPLSPDLNPHDFYLWGASKSVVCRDRPLKLDDFKVAIMAFIRSVSGE